jgi:hypothetical protein
LAEEESQTLVQTYSLFLKFTKDMYCIDVDGKEIHSMDEIVQKTGCDLFVDCPWTQGNTKGIHIYLRIKDMVEYSDQTDVFATFHGDLIKTNNMWERMDKSVNHTEKGMIEFEYDTIKHIFNNKINKEAKPEKKLNSKVGKVEVKASAPQMSTLSKASTVTQRCLETYIRLGVKHEIFQKMSGWELWNKKLDMSVKMSLDEQILHVTKFLEKLKGKRQNKTKITKNNQNQLS